MESERDEIKRGESRDEAAGRILKCFEDGMRYQSEMGFVQKFPKFVDFFEGRQWPAATKNTQNLPRPVFNCTKMIGRNKKSAILSVPGKIVYHAENDSDRVKVFNDFAAYIQKEMKQDALDKDAIDDGVKKGSYHYHYFWDENAHGLDATAKGALRCEIVDPLKIFFSNPNCHDEQRQKWILIATREEVSSVRAMADSDVNKADIAPDKNTENHYGEKEQGDGLVTVLTRYFRVNGEVWWEKATKSMLICAPRPLAPDVEGALREMGMDEQGDGGSANGAPVRGFSLYPIVSGSYERREGSIYGIGEVEGLLPVQKAINLLFALLILNNQQVAWGKYVVHPQALRGQRLTNEPGEVITDYSPGANGIRKLTEQVMQSQPIELATTMLNLLRSVSGATEVMTGETVGSNMSGAAIAALQAQAQQPVEELRESFWQVKVRQGLVLAEFFKHYYAGKHFTYSVKAEDGTEQIADGVFDGAAFADLTFDVVVEAARGSKSSTAGDINMLDAALASKAIDFETYVAIYPEDAISHKDELQEALRALKQSENAQLKAQVEQMQQLLTAMQQQREQEQRALASVMETQQENRRLQQALAILAAEAKKAVNAANEQIRLGNEALKQVRGDAAEFAEHIAKAEGVRVPTEAPITGDS
ncbi:MAG: hypothetical protein E7590_07490 [Ruminococcaceae bacterium]|nr:hypothetical protein [Oscillospiraceae bacterium]MBE6701900.1 hypothetical protein [Oscillospiraceae bacterium]